MLAASNSNLACSKAKFCQANSSLCGFSCSYKNRIEASASCNSCSAYLRLTSEFIDGTRHAIDPWNQSKASGI
ncbi:hypothetical protein QUA56_34610 [Microcoleus sp. N3A4]|uniref:hypothetical protein n=1 Tax=Microcoleus sp. N3A4 TaxID=3055379 RepID=UPI002FCEC4CA